MYIRSHVLRNILVCFVIVAVLAGAVHWGNLKKALLPTAEAEIIVERGYSYEIKRFLEPDKEGNGVYKGRFYQGHIFYKTEDGTFENIDTRLSFNQETRRWEQKKASYHLSAPEFSDQEIAFHDLFKEKDQTVSIRPLTSRVKGDLVTTGEFADRAVIYPGAFGPKTDLLLFADNEKLEKLVVINERPELILEETTFDFELLLPDGLEIFNASNGESDILNKKIQADQVLIGRSPKDEDSTVFRRFRVWDSSGQQEFISVRFFKKNGRVFFQKIIPGEFLKKAVYPVYTDTTLSVFATAAGDGRVGNIPGAGGSWAATHDAAAGTISNTGAAAGTFIDIREDGSNLNDYQLSRVFFPFDTSAIPSNTNMVSATLNLYVSFLSDGDDDGDDFITVVETTQADSAALSVAQYNEAGATTTPIEGINTGERKDITNIVDDTYFAFNLNSTGLGWIKRSGETASCGTNAGVTCLGVREGHDVLNNSIATDTRNNVTFQSANTGGTSQDPFLEVIYTDQPIAASGEAGVETRIRGGVRIKGGTTFR